MIRLPTSARYLASAVPSLRLMRLVLRVTTLAHLNAEAR